MSLMQLIRARRSVRRYAERTVERSVIEECLEAARLAPSAENTQPWRFVVVYGLEVKARLSEAAFSGASPVVVSSGILALTSCSPMWYTRNPEVGYRGS